MSNELATVTPMDLISRAIDGGMKLDDLGKLFDLQERWEKSQAAKAYAEAISGFQAECPPIAKARPVMNKGGGSVRFKFAAWEDIAPTVNPLLAKFNIAVSFSTPESVNPGAFTMTLRVQVGTHVVEFPFTAPYPDVQAIADASYCSFAQGVGVINSYFKRYHFINVFNITIVGEDNEALLAATAGACITEEEVQELRDLLEDRNKNEDAFLTWIQKFQPGCESIERIAAANMPKIMHAANLKTGAMKS